MDDKIIYVVSSCLAGSPCRYDGKSNSNREVMALYASGRAIPVCPECLGGLPTPRQPSELLCGDGAEVLAGRARVMTVNGCDVTEQFVTGALAALTAARQAGATHAILKAKSPSCGCGEIYDGSFKRRFTAGDGVTAALFKQKRDNGGNTLRLRR